MGKILVFYGRKNDNVELYLRDFKRACIGNGDRRPEDWLQLLPSFLEDEALRWFEKLPADRRETWDNLSAALIENFEPMDRYENLLGEMASLSQGIEESIGSYGARVEKLLARFRRHLHRSGGANQVAGIEGLVLKGFIAGMKPQIREMVKYEGANTFSHALEIAIR